MAEDRVLETIPHRPPFLFVDEVVEVAERRVRARRTFRADEQFFQGHYPDRPIVPGVLLCEAIFQTGALLVGLILMPEGAPGKLPVLTRVREAKFRRAVSPGETVDLEVEFLEQVANVFVFKGRARVGDKDAVRVEFACALVDR